MLDLLAAIQARYSSTDLATTFTSVGAGQVDPSKTRPYLAVMPDSDVPNSRTNYGRYGDLNFRIVVVVDTVEQSISLAYQLKDRLLNPALVFASAAGDQLMIVAEGPTAFKQEDLYWTATVSFKASLSRPPYSRTY